MAYFQPVNILQPLTEMNSKQPDAPEVPLIGLNFRITGPVELGELTGALNAFHRQYSRRVRQTQRTHTGAVPGQEETRLFIRKLETGSILADLAPWTESAINYAPLILPLLEYHNTFRDFVSYTREYIDFLLGRSQSPDSGSLTTIPSDFADILAPIARRRGGALEIEMKRENADGQKTEITCRYTSEEAVIAHAKALELASANDRGHADHQKVLLWLPRLDATVHPQSGNSTPDRGVIERICKRPLRVIWASEQDSMRIKSAPGNPLQNSYLVDVNVENRNGKPVLYNIVKLHEIIPAEDELIDDTLPGINS